MPKCFLWVIFLKTKGGIKLHTLYDITTQIPAFINITASSVHDVNAMDVIPYENGAYYIMTEVMYRPSLSSRTLSAFFVLRAKSKLKFNRRYSRKVDKQPRIICDQIGNLSCFYVFQIYLEKLQRIKFYDAESKRYFVYLTNNMDLTAGQIALLYKNRWQIELL